MAVALLTLEVRIEHAQSLKDRRQVVRSLKDQLRQGFNISVAELDEAVQWQSATIGVVAVSRSRDYLHGAGRRSGTRGPAHAQRTGRRNLPTPSGTTLRAELNWDSTLKGQLVR